MGHLTSIFIVLAFIAALNCAPVDDSSVNPPAIAYSTTVSPSSTTEIHTASKRRASKEDSSDSKESDESSEENKRPARDTESSGVVAHEARQDSSTLGLIQTPAPVTKETPTPQLPTRERRGVYYDGGNLSPGTYSATSESTTSGATTSSTTHKPNY